MGCVAVPATRAVRQRISSWSAARERPHVRRVWRRDSNTGIIAQKPICGRPFHQCPQRERTFWVWTPNLNAFAERFVAPFEPSIGPHRAARRTPPSGESA